MLGNIQYFDEIYQSLKDAYHKNFPTCKQKCKEIQLCIDKYYKATFIRSQFDPGKHQPSFTLVREYLQLEFSSDRHQNIDFQCYEPVDIFNDGSVLFRAITWLTGPTQEQHVRLLRIRCLVDVLANLDHYLCQCEDLRDGFTDPDQFDPSHWTDFICEREKMNSPNIITMLILISLAKLIKIPIRSIYFDPLEEDSNDQTNNLIHKKLNRTFYPDNAEHPLSENLFKPIVILWWSTQTNTGINPDHVVPLFPITHPVANEKSIPFFLSTKANGDPSKNNENSCDIQRNRCTYILIDKTINDNQTDSTNDEIIKLKRKVIQQMKLIARTAQCGDIIQVNTSDTELTQPPLIPFCQATQVDNEENFRRIENIQFKKCFNNLLVCIAAAKRQMEQQLTYYTDLFIFKINSIHFSNKDPFQRSAIRRLKESRTVKTQIFHFSQQINTEKEHFHKCGINAVYLLHNETVNHSYDHAHNGLRREIIINYEQSVPSSNTQLTQTTSDSSLNADVPLVTTHVILHYIAQQTSTTQRSHRSPNNHSTSQIRTDASPWPSTKDNKSNNGSMEQHYRVPDENINQFPFKVGFT